MGSRFTVADGDFFATGENCVWDYDETPGDKGTPVNGDSVTINHALTASAGTISLASMILNGVADPEQAASLAVSGTADITALSFSHNETVVSLAVSGGSLEITTSQGIYGPSWAPSGVTGGIWVSHSGGTFVINGDVHAGAAGGDEEGNHGAGSPAIGFANAGDLIVNGDIYAGAGATGTYNDEPWEEVGGSAILRGSGSGGTITINGDLYIDTTDEAHSGNAVHDVQATLITVNGNVTGARVGGVLVAALVGKQTVGSVVVKGAVTGYNSAKITLTGSLTVDEGEAWVYHVFGSLTLNVASLDLTNNGTFVIFNTTGNTSNVTVTNAEVTNGEGAQFATHGCTIPTVNWPSSGYAYGDADATKVLTTATGAGTYQPVATTDVKKDVPVGVSPAVGSYDPMAAAVWPAEANVSMTETAWGPTGANYAGALDMALYQLKTESVLISAISAAIVVDGETITATSGAAHVDGTYPTTATSKGEQLVVDQAAVDAGKVDILNTRTILGVQGTLPPTPSVEEVQSACAAALAAYAVATTNDLTSAGFAHPGDAMALTADERTSVGSAVAAALAITTTKIAQLWRRAFGKVKFTKTGTGTGTIETYAADGETVELTQAYTEDATTQTQGAAE